MVEIDPEVGAVVYDAELTRLGAIVCGAEVPRPHAEPYRAGADVAQGRRRRSQRRARRQDLRCSCHSLLSRATSSCHNLQRCKNGRVTDKEQASDNVMTICGEELWSPLDITCFPFDK